jgi:hypothetical protein
MDIAIVGGLTFIALGIFAILQFRDLAKTSGKHREREKQIAEIIEASGRRSTMRARARARGVLLARRVQAWAGKSSS